MKDIKVMNTYASDRTEETIQKVTKTNKALCSTKPAVKNKEGVN